jgi:hypothetical protein
MRIIVPLAAASLALVLAGPAHADPQKARELVVGSLERLAGDIKGQAEMTWDEPQVSSSSGGDVIAIPNLQIAGEKAKFEIGRVEFTVSDLPAAGGSPRNRIAVKLTPKMTVTPAGAPPVDITFEDHGFTAVWMPELEVATDVNFSYTNVVVADRGGNGQFKVGELLMETKRDDDPALWTGTARFAARKLTATGKTTAGSFSLDEFAETIAIDKLPLKEIAAFNKQFRALVNGRNPQEIEKEEWLPVIDRLESLPLGDGGRVEVSLSGLSVKSPDGSGGLDRAAFGFGLKRAGQDVADAALAFSLDGLDVPVPTMQELVPKTGKLDVKLLSLPAAPLWAAFLNAAREGVQSGPEEAREQMTAQLLEIAHNTNAQLQVALALAAAAMSGDATSDFRFDPESAFGLVGTARLAVLGLDPMLEKLRKSGSQDEQVQQAMAALSMMKGFGRTEVANNAVAYIYDFKLDKSGAMTLNGQDLQTLMSQGQGSGENGQKKGPGGKPPQRNKS